MSPSTTNKRDQGSRMAAGKSRTQGHTAGDRKQIAARLE
jgi:hypothetical protein